MEIEILNEPQLRALVKMAYTIAADETLLAIFCAFCEKTSLRGEWHREWSDLPFDPFVQERLSEDVSLFYLLAYLAALPGVEQQYRKRGITNRILVDTLRDFPIWMDQYFQAYGRWGFNQFMWIWRHLTCQLFCLGRLQFMLAPFWGGVTAFRNKKDGRVLLLADPQTPLRADGYALGAGLPEVLSARDVPAPTNGWLPVFEAGASGWRGFPISPYGFALKTETFLPNSQWDLILQRGDWVLDMHIPRPGVFTVETCRASLLQAETFFARQYPARPHRAFFCHTWFFAPQLQQMLPSDSNIVRFQREFYLYPFPGSPNSLWTFVFGEQFPDPKTAPRDTSLRRAVLEWLDRGNELFELTGLVFHGPQQWGSQPYMRRWDSRPPGQGWT